MIKKILIGKKVTAIDAGLDDWGISFDDGSGLAVYTKMEIVLFSQLGEMVVSAVNSNVKRLELSLGKKSHIHIFLDEELLTGPEFYCFQDLNGTIIVGN